MLPDRVSNPGPLTDKSGALPIALRGPAKLNLRLIATLVFLFVSVVLFEQNLLSIYFPFDFLSLPFRTPHTEHEFGKIMT